VPEYYERDARKLPPRWLERMRKSISSTLWQFSTTRMLHEYAEGLYLPAAGIAVSAPAALAEPGTAPIAGGEVAILEANPDVHQAPVE